MSASLAADERKRQPERRRCSRSEAVYASSIKCESMRKSLTLRALQITHIVRTQCCGGVPCWGPMLLERDRIPDGTTCSASISELQQLCSAKHCRSWSVSVPMMACTAAAAMMCNGLLVWHAAYRTYSSALTYRMACVDWTAMPLAVQCACFLMLGGATC
jgi:hypothetical protein